MGWNDRMDHPEVYGERYDREEGQRIYVDSILREAASHALHQVNATARKFADIDHDLNLYVYPSGNWVIEDPQYLLDHNTLAQAPIFEYDSVLALVAALGETVDE